MNDSHKTRPQIVQARRFADSLTYNAWSALRRVESLLHDAAELEDLLAAELQDANAPLRSWYGFEIVSYYLVGLVTALEWHVRTRLADLYTYSPDAIDKKALDGKISPDTLSQMIRADVTIPHLLSASTTVSSAADYFGALQHVFDTLGIRRSATALAPARIPMTSVFGDPITEPSAFQTVGNLFTARHALVHEIGVARGQRFDANNWALPDIRRFGGVVLDLMRTFECVLTESAPPDFPNLLDQRGYPVDELKGLRDRIAAVKERIRIQIEDRNPPSAVVGAAWTRASADQEALYAFIAENELLQSWHINHGPAIAKLELQQRLKVLDALAGTLEAQG